MLTESLRRICELQPTYSADNTPAMQERGSLIRQTVPSELRSLRAQLVAALGQFGADFDTDASDGIGRKTEAPWVRFHSKALSPSPREGYYVVLHFAADGSAMFVTVGCGSTAWIDGTLKAVSDDELARRTDWAREVITRRFGTLDPFDDAIVLGARAALPRTFERATVCAKRVSSDELDEASVEQLLVQAAERLAAVYEAQNKQGSTPQTQNVCWFVGAAFGRTDDQTARFLTEGIWEISGPNATEREAVLSMRPGDRIAIKAAHTARNSELPFDARGKRVSAMTIKATGVVTDNPGDGEHVLVDWTSGAHPRTWLFYTYRKTIWRVTSGSFQADALIRFSFDGEAQDYDWWLAQPHWAEKYGQPQDGAAPSTEEAGNLKPGFPPYSLADIVAEGCFVPEPRLKAMLQLLQRKKNVVLQGPPGTGKTWLARRLAYALVGARDPDRVTAVQFQPSYAYEDFVLGYRPSSDGRLQLVEGLFLRLIAQARRTDGPIVLVIEEINRGDPAQVFGELLTLLEAGQREGEGLRLAYAAAGDAPTSVPENLYVIGTMNLADRSLALVDLALRRRFGFVDLQPELGERWHAALLKLGAPAGFLVEVAARMGELNATIDGARGLGEQFRVGHSYVTPSSRPGDDADAWAGWWRSVVRDELGPLLREYWHEEPETARRHADRLLVGL